VRENRKGFRNQKNDDEHDDQACDSCEAAQEPAEKVVSRPTVQNIAVR